MEPLALLLSMNRIVYDSVLLDEIDTSPGTYGTIRVKRSPQTNDGWEMPSLAGRFDGDDSGDHCSTGPARFIASTRANLDHITFET